MSRSVIETILGAVVLLVAAIFLLFAYRSSDVGKVSGYELVARFTNIGGLQDGADVRVGGIKVGSVTGQKLDTENYFAIIKLSIEPDVKLPRDTTASIASESLLGGRYISLEPGGDSEFIKPGGMLLSGNSALQLEQLIGQMMFSTKNQKTDGGSASPAPQ